ncbi:STAS domain-containing protein [Nocardia asteroides]
MTCQYGVEGIRTGDGLLLAVHGELDAATADDCFAAMTEIVETHRDPTDSLSVVVDLCEVRFLSCAGVRVVLRLAGWCARADIPVGMTVPFDDFVRRIVELLAVSRSVPVVACPAHAAHTDQPRKCRSSGAVRADDAAGRTECGPGRHRRLPADTAHRPHSSGGGAATSATSRRDERCLEPTATPSPIRNTANKTVRQRST